MAETTGPVSNGVSSADGGVQSLERAFVLLELMDEDGGEGALSRLAGRLLVEVGGAQTWTPVFGPGVPGDGFTWLEWSNALAGVLAASSGEPVDCVFLDIDDQSTETVALRVRPLFVRSAETSDVVPVVDEAVAEPGELTQSLCSPWQNDYRECGCYYWAASRPDYVNVETTAQGASVGNNWLARNRLPKRYDVPDQQQVGYDELFRNWQGLLRFVVEGRDHD